MLISIIIISLSFNHKFKNKILKLKNEQDSGLDRSLKVVHLNLESDLVAVQPVDEARVGKCKAGSEHPSTSGQPKHW